MPIHYEIEYLNVSGDPDCDEATTVTATMVQDYIAERVPDGESTAEYVEYVNLYFWRATTNDSFPTQSFTLYLDDTGYKINDVGPTQTVTNPLGGDPAATLAITTDTSLGNDRHVLTFSLDTSNSDDNNTTVFEFGVGTPGTKLKIKVKKQTGSFAC